MGVLWSCLPQASDGCLSSCFHWVVQRLAGWAIDSYHIWRCRCWMNQGDLGNEKKIVFRFDVCSWNVFGYLILLWGAWLFGRSTVGVVRVCFHHLPRSIAEAELDRDLNLMHLRLNSQTSNEPWVFLGFRQDGWVLHLQRLIDNFIHLDSSASRATDYALPGWRQSMHLQVGKMVKFLRFLRFR